MAETYGEPTGTAETYGEPTGNLRGAPGNLRGTYGEPTGSSGEPLLERGLLVFAFFLLLTYFVKNNLSF